MLHRIGISIDDNELILVRSLQKKFHIKNRSMFFRELVKRYEQMEDETKALQKCINGYLKNPEGSEQANAVLKSTLKTLSPEVW